MKESKVLLNRILRVSQLGMISIEIAEKAETSTCFREELRRQFQEYGQIERETYTIAARRGWALRELSPAILFYMQCAVRWEIRQTATDRDIAEKMIWGNTKGLIQCAKSRNRFQKADALTGTLLQKLIDTQNANISSLLKHL